MGTLTMFFWFHLGFFPSSSNKITKYPIKAFDMLPSYMKTFKRSKIEVKTAKYQSDSAINHHPLNKKRKVLSPADWPSNQPNLHESRFFLASRLAPE